MNCGFLSLNTQLVPGIRLYHSNRFCPGSKWSGSTEFHGFGSFFYGFGWQSKGTKGKPSNNGNSVKARLVSWGIPTPSGWKWPTLEGKKLQAVPHLSWINLLCRQMAMDQYLYIPFLGGWTSINPSYFDVHQGDRVLTHCQMKCQDGYEFIGGSSGDPAVWPAEANFSKLLLPGMNDVCEQTGSWGRNDFAVLLVSA